jgi:metal-responsive CopG/Arc/MetJ family transcriptional regulator
LSITGRLRGRKNKQRALRDRCTIFIDTDVNEQLDVVARIEQKERSEIVTEILRTHLPKYRVEIEAA